MMKMIMKKGWVEEGEKLFKPIPKILIK